MPSHSEAVTQVANVSMYLLGVHNLRSGEFFFLGGGGGGGGGEYIFPLPKKKIA